MNSEDHSHVKILIVDDTATNQELLKRTFENEGFAVIQAYDGSDALDMVQKERPDLIMLDIMLPKMDGVEVLKRVKAMDPEMLVVMMTAHGSQQIAVETMKLGADDYLTKPFHPKDVTASAEKLIKARRVRRENLELKSKIERTERYLAHLVNSVNEAIISVDASGKILSFNLAAEKLWGMGVNDATGKDIGELFFKGKSPHYVDRILEETEKNGGFEGEFLFLTHDGSTFPGHLNTSKILDEVSGKGAVALVRSLTEEKKLQQQLLESQKLAALGKVVEGVAHEVRNPLLSIGGFTRRISSQTDASSHHKKYLEAIIKDVERLERMVTDIEEYVKFSKLQVLSHEKINIQSSLNDILANLHERLSDSKISSILDIPDQLPHIFANKFCMDELFHNIIENAIEAMPDGGKLGIAVKIDGNYLVTDISDTGAGIADNTINDIFNPFFTSKMSGAGLGLTKCHMIVSDHQGFIRVKSAAGYGTTFSIGLPIELRQRVMI